MLKVNAGQVIMKNDSDWRSFFELLKLKKQGRLPPFTKKVPPPGYRKDKVMGKRKLIVIIRSDRYYIERVEDDLGYIVLIVLKDYNKKLKYYSKLMWSGRRGDLEIVYDGRHWQAHIPVGVEEEPPKSNKKGRVEGIGEMRKKGRPVRTQRALSRRILRVVT